MTNISIINAHSLTMTNMPHNATTSLPTTTTSSSNNKRVRICLESVRVFHMPQDNREEYLDRLFYSPQEIKVFQDEKFEEEAAALQLRKEKEAAQRKQEKELKKQQRKERLHARKQARLHKTHSPTADTPTTTRPSTPTTTNYDDNDSDYGLLSTSASSSSDSDEPAYPSMDAQSPQRQPPKKTTRRVRHRKSTKPSATLAVDLSALPVSESDPCETPSSVSTASTECSTPLDSPTISLHHLVEEPDIEAAVALLPKEQTETKPTTSMAITTNLQTQLNRWKRSTLLLFGLLILSWMWFSLAVVASSFSSSSVNTGESLLRGHAPSPSSFTTSYSQEPPILVDRSILHS
jgi:hypothetical protein